MSLDEDVEAKAVDLGWLFDAQEMGACHDKSAIRNVLPLKPERKNDCDSFVIEEEKANIDFGGSETEGAPPPTPVQVESSEPLPPWWVFSRLISPSKKAKPVQEEADDACLTAQYEASVENDGGDSLSKSDGDAHHSVAFIDTAGRESNKRPAQEYQGEKVISGGGALLSELKEDNRKPAASNDSAPLESRKRPAQEYPNEKRHAKRQQLAKKSPNTARQESDDEVSIPPNGKPLCKSSPTVAARAPVVARNATLANGKPLRKSSPTAATTTPVVPRNGTVMTGQRFAPKVPTPRWCSSTIEEVGSDVIPHGLVANYPQYVRSHTSAAGTRNCIMCSVEASFVSSKKAAKNASRLILLPSRRVCSVCWSSVWELADGTSEIYCCHTCGHWRPWAAFRGSKKMMKSCLVCRNVRDKSVPIPDLRHIRPFEPSAATGASPVIENPAQVPERNADMLTNDTEQDRKQLDETTLGIAVGKGTTNSSVPIQRVASASTGAKALQGETHGVTKDSDQDTRQLNEMKNGVSVGKRAQNSELTSKRIRKDVPGKVSQSDTDMLTNDTEQHRKQLDETTNGVSVRKRASNSAAKASKRVAPAAVAGPSIRKGNPVKASQRNTAIALNNAGQGTNQHEETMNGLSPSNSEVPAQRVAANPRTRCVKVVPSPTFCSSTLDSRWIAPRFRDLINYPSLLWQRASESSTKICLMCGIECPLVGRSDPPGGNNEKIGVIWQFEKSVCSLCQVGVWNMVDSDMHVKWCATCFDFRPWGCFHVKDSTGVKELSTCVICRDSRKKRSTPSKSEIQSAPPTTENASKSSATPSRKDKRKVVSRPIMQWDAR